MHFYWSIDMVCGQNVNEKGERKRRRRRRKRKKRMDFFFILLSASSDKFIPYSTLGRDLSVRKDRERETSIMLQTGDGNFYCFSIYE